VSDSQLPQYRPPLEARGSNGIVVFDGEYVSIVRSGGLARWAWIFAGEKKIPLTAVAAVRWQPPTATMDGFIALTLRSGKGTSPDVTGAGRAAAKDPHAVMVAPEQAELMLMMRDAIERALARLREQ
jgi:hypothetical protein